MVEPVLRASGLSRSFGGVQAVKDVSFDVMPATVVGIIGPNGAGKTTLFNLISGFVKPSSGSVAFLGRTIEFGKADRIARTGIGRTFQTVKVFADLSVTDNLRVADYLASSVRDGSFGERVSEVLQLVGMNGFAQRTAGHLSYGQQKLIEIAMVLMNRPSLILLDEPVAGVNPVLIQQIAHLIRDLRNRGLALVIVEHNVPFVTEICDQVIVMAGGRKFAEGTGAEIRQNSEVLEAFLGG